MVDAVEESRQFEGYLKSTGWGLYYNLILGLACAACFVQAVTFMAIPLGIAFSTCDNHFIPERIVLKIFTSFYFGSCIGGVITNFLNDRYGRKKYLSYSFMIVFLSTFTAAFAHNPYVIIGASFFLGVGLESNMVSIKILLIEVLPKDKRGFFMMLCSLFGALGYVVSSALSLAFDTPMLSNAEKPPDIRLTTWRIMFAACGGANLLLACACALIEESPRYFLQVGRSYLAYLVLKQFYAINNSSFADTFKVKEEDIKYIIKQYGLFYFEPETNWEILKKLIWRFYKSLQLLFSRRFCQTTVCLILLKIPVLAIGILHLNASLAKLLIFQDFPEIAQNKLKSLDFVYLVWKPMAYMSREELENATGICAVNEYNYDFFKYFLTLGGATVPGIVVALCFVDLLGRKVVLFGGLLSSSCSFIMLGFFRQPLYQVVLSSVVLASVSSVTATISLINFEVYPTALRGTSCAVTSFMGIFLAIFFINFIVINSRVFTMYMGVVYFCISFLALFLPEMKRRPMVE